MSLRIEALNDKGERVSQSVELVLPASLWVRRAIEMSFRECTSTHMRSQIMAAALFSCWPDAAGKRGAPKYQHDMHAFGAAVLEYMFRRDADELQLAEACIAALNLILESVPSAADKEAARGNLQAPSGG